MKKVQDFYVQMFKAGRADAYMANGYGYFAVTKEMVLDFPALAPFMLIKIRRIGYGYAMELS